MSGESLARLFVGIGFLWVVIVLLVGLVAGLDKPSAWVRLLGDALETETTRYVYLALALFVVPVGMLTLLLDIWGDPGALWVKCAAPGAFLAVYSLFLAAALPDVGRPILLGFEPLVAAFVPLQGLRDTPDASASWLVRFLAAFAVLAGIPGVVGGILGLFSGPGSGTRRP